ncbi:tissue inhibitor of metalloproteinase domain-containing protein [Ditylenchus destructor]|nr:tissue inhibitor of metalloproteinase domain-containing protein [Ditylenchus destructor]
MNSRISTLIPKFLPLAIFLCWANLQTEACKCRVQLPFVSYCNAHWVAHTRIESRQPEQKMPPGIVDRQVFKNFHYKVNHIDTFKFPEELNRTTLPKDIYSAQEDAACGIVLEQGHEYLLTGRYVNGTMLTTLCGQILYDDLKKAKYEDILEWNEVPNSLRNRLKIKAFEPQCASLAVLL